jgi:hypothetical protein
MTLNHFYKLNYDIWSGESFPAARIIIVPATTLRVQLFTLCS